MLCTCIVSMDINITKCKDEMDQNWESDAACQRNNFSLRFTIEIDCVQLDL